MKHGADRDRSTLHENHIDEFVAWAEARGWLRVETKGEYEKLRLVRKKPRRGEGPAIFYQRARSTPHFTAYGIGLDLVEAFFRGVTYPKRRGITDRDEQSDEVSR